MKVRRETEKAEISSDYFSKAVKLSPNNARLWDEWALLLLNTLKRPEDAFERLDPVSGDRCRVPLDVRASRGLLRPDKPGSGWPEAQVDALQKAAENYARALDLPAPGEPQASFSYALALGNTYSPIA